MQSFICDFFEAVATFWTTISVPLSIYLWVCIAKRQTVYTVLCVQLSTHLSGFQLFENDIVSNKPNSVLSLE